MTERAEPEDAGGGERSRFIDPGEDALSEPSPPEAPETPDPESGPFEEPSGEWLGEAELEPEE